ncbi:MAG TPA: hypothetical protein VFE98_00785 [Candidatus Bathyarchaeia archaeon]|nr:hypothetical protein [Candidatus Bathyarchaeia archaeon]
MSTIDEIADNIEKFRLEQRKTSDELSQTKAKARFVRTELQKLRSTRDKLNDNVRGLKETRNILQKESKDSLAVLRGLLRRMADKPHASLAEKELADLEWKVQTSPMDKDEEKKMMLKIRGLETKVTAYHKVQKLREEVTKKREEADNVHARIQQLAAESQGHHQQIVQLSEAFERLRARQEIQQKTLDEIRQKSAEANQKYLDLKNSLTESEKKIQRQKEEAFKEAMKTTAKKKAGQGEKLTLHELAALLGEDEH